MQAERANWDAHSARINLLRTKTLLGEADVVVVRFGTKFRQWNAAFDATPCGKHTACGENHKFVYKAESQQDTCQPCAAGRHQELQEHYETTCNAMMCVEPADPSPAY